MPSADSRSRSRTACSAADNPAPELRLLGSTMSRSTPELVSQAQRQVTGSLPVRDRAKNTFVWSGLTRRSRGSPSVNLRVRAYWRGNEPAVNGRCFPQQWLRLRFPTPHRRSPLSARCSSQRVDQSVFAGQQRSCHVCAPLRSPHQQSAPQR